MTPTAASKAVLTRALPVARLGTAADCRRFAVDGVLPGAVAFPESAAEVTHVLRAATEAGLRVLPAGLGAHLVIGMPPPAVDCAVGTERLARVVEHAAADMTVTVEAGATLAAVNNVLAAAGQWLPIDSPVPCVTTIGGLVSANLSGPVRLSQGSVRDLLLGLRAVRADGTVIASGGRVVKNVAGYDLHKAFVGAHGTLGIILEATFKVRPLPPGVAAVVVSCPSIDAAGTLVTAVREAAVEPLWLTVASPDTLPDSAVRELPRPSDGASVVIIGIAGASRSLAVQRERIVALASRYAPRGDLVAVHDGEGPRVFHSDGIYGRLRDFPATTEGGVVVTVMLLPTVVPDYLMALGAESRTSGIRARYVADAGIARIHILLTSGRGKLEPIVAARLVERLRALAAERHGHLTIRAADPEVKRLAGVWGDLGPAAFLMHRLRRAFDPRGLLSAGRFLEAA